MVNVRIVLPCSSCWLVGFTGFLLFSRTGGIFPNTYQRPSRCGFSHGCHKLTAGVPEERSESVFSQVWSFYISIYKHCMWTDACHSPGETILGLRENMTQAIHRLQETDSSVAVSSGGELFLRFISLTSLEHPVSVFKMTLIYTSSNDRTSFCFSSTMQKIKWSPAFWPTGSLAV